jgi:hypothetical protein
LDSGELAIDTATGQLYSLVAGVITEINGDPKQEYSDLYINKTDKQDVQEGGFVLKFSDDSDSLPFVGRIGYNGAVTDPLAMEGSYRSQRRSRNAGRQRHSRERTPGR